jgi:hypothetical protein
MIEQLVFLKQLLDNIEYVNEQGTLNAVSLLRSECAEVRQGTAYAAGAADTLRVLFERRPELRTGRVLDELRALARDPDASVRASAEGLVREA